MLKTETAIHNLIIQKYYINNIILLFPEGSGSLTMPSKYEKERAKAKKEAAKQKGGKKASSVTADAETNGTNGVKEKTPPETNGAGSSPAPTNLTYEEELCQKLEDEARLAAEARACTGVLGIHPMARDIKIDNFSVTFYGANLLQDTKLELSVGNRWDLCSDLK